MDKPLDIYLTRYSDTLISLSDRTKLAKALKADLFLSLHCNHSDNPNARGVEVYVTNAESKYSDDSTWFAFQVQAALNKELGYESCTSVLIELGFLSNKDEGNYISNSNNIQLIATAILLSIQN